MLQSISFVEVIFCWVVWALGFINPRKLAEGQAKVISAPASKWGIILQALGSACTWAYVRPTAFVKPEPLLILAMIVAPASAVLGWAAARHLGKQWRFEAALSENHELVQSGPYSWVRHPIYASMLGLLLATGLVWTWWPMQVAGLLFFLIGTEVRVRAEDRLLSERFGSSFAAYRSRVPAYIPFLR